MKANHHSITIKMKMVVKIVNPRIVILNSTTLYNSNVLDTYFLLLFFNSQQIKLFWSEYHEYI